MGDVQYGGAVPNTSSLYKERCKGRAESFLDSERLALQCCTLEFLDPHYELKSDGSDSVKRSERWNTFRLDSAFWTKFVTRYHDESAKMAPSEATSSLDVERSIMKQANPEIKPQSVGDESRTDTVPPRILLSQGVNKYIVVRAVLPDMADQELWFVRSATPEECGGPYHANVASSLLRELESLGYTATCTGGGRIDFVSNQEVEHAHVYGFSYGFGKGDHEKVAEIIEQHSDIIATYDNSDGLY